jgi:capsular polysaccharide biosynthesis protein
LTSRLGLIVLGLVVGAAAGALVSKAVGSSFEADAILVTAPENPRGEVEDEYGVAFARLATRRAIVGPPLREAGFEEIADEPESAIRSRASIESPSFAITASADDPEEATEIANIAAEAISEFTVERAPETGFRVAVIAPADDSSEETSLGTALAMLAGAALGVGLALLFVLARPSR